MQTYRIGIIGTENSHAADFSRLINVPLQDGSLRYPDCRVTVVYGHDLEASRQLVSKYGIDRIAESVEEMVGQVDAVMITARDGKYHREFAEPFLRAGIPAFIDKPFTVDPAETLHLIRLAKEKNVPLCGGSSVKFSEDLQALRQLIEHPEHPILGGSVAAPIYVESEYSGFYFYASHLVEMTLEVFGYQPRKISAIRHNSGVCATIHYDEYVVTNHFNEGACDYNVCVYTKRGSHYQVLDASKIGQLECDDFVNMLRTKVMSHSYEVLAAPVFYMNAVKHAYETGETVTLDLRGGL